MMPLHYRRHNIGFLFCAVRGRWVHNHAFYAVLEPRIFTTMRSSRWKCALNDKHGVNDQQGYAIIMAPRARFTIGLVQFQIWKSPTRTNHYALQLARLFGAPHGFDFSVICMVLIFR